jgi:hypothetical protein
MNTNDYAELRRRTDAERVLFGEFNNDPTSAALALLDARDRITTLTRELDEAQANALRYALEVSRLLLDSLDALTTNTTEAQ